MLALSVSSLAPRGAGKQIQTFGKFSQNHFEFKKTLKLCQSSLKIATFSEAIIQSSYNYKSFLTNWEKIIEADQEISEYELKFFFLTDVSFLGTRSTRD